MAPMASPSQGSTPPVSGSNTSALEVTEVAPTVGDELPRLPANLGRPDANAAIMDAQVAANSSRRICTRFAG